MSIQQALIQTRGDVFAAALLVEVMASPNFRADTNLESLIPDLSRRMKLYKQLKPLYIKTYNKFALPALGLPEIREFNLFKGSEDDIVKHQKVIHENFKQKLAPYLKRKREAGEGLTKVQIQALVRKFNAFLWLFRRQISLLGQDNQKLTELLPGRKTDDRIILLPDAAVHWPGSEQEQMLDLYLEEVKRIVQEAASDDAFADMPPSDNDSPGDGDSDMPSSADSSDSSSGSGSSGGVDSYMAPGGPFTPLQDDVPFGHSSVLNRTIEYNLNTISTMVADDIYYEDPEGVFWQDIGGTWTSTSDEPDKGSKLRLGYRDDEEEPFFVYTDTEITMAALPTLKPEIEGKLNEFLELDGLSEPGGFVINLYGVLYINYEGGWKYVVNQSELDGDREWFNLTIRNGEVQIAPFEYPGTTEVEIRGELELRELYNLDAWRKNHPNNRWAYVDDDEQTWIVEDELWIPANTPLEPGEYKTVRQNVDEQWGRILESGRLLLPYAEVPKLTLSTVRKIKDHIAGNSSSQVGKYVFLDGDDYYEDDEAGNWHYVYQVEPGRTELYAQYLSGESEGSTDDHELSSDHESPAVGTSSDDSLSSASTLSELPGVGTSSDDSLPLDDSEGKPPVRIDLMGETGVTLIQTPLRRGLNRFIRDCILIDPNFQTSLFYYEETKAVFHVKTPDGDWRIDEKEPEFGFKIVEDEKVYRFESIFENDVKIDEQNPSQELETAKALLRHFGPMTVSENQVPLLRQLLEEYFNATLNEGVVYRVGKVKPPPPPPPSFSKTFPPFPSPDLFF